MATHVPFRSWCPYCIMGKAPAGAHRQSKDEAEGLPIISLDYAFMGSGMEGDGTVQNPIIVIEDSKFKQVAAHMVPRKGWMNTQWVE